MISRMLPVSWIDVQSRKQGYLRAEASCDLDGDVVADGRNLLENHSGPEPERPCKTARQLSGMTQADQQPFLR